MTSVLYRVISATLENNTVIINTEFGHKLAITLKPVVSIDATTVYPDNHPDLEVNVVIEKTVLVDSSKALPQSEIEEILKERGIIPEGLDFDHIFVGFVYADNSNPLNHHWWLDFRKGQASVYNYYTHSLELRAAINTFSWPDAGFSHGRFKITKGDIKIIKDEKGRVTVWGNPVEIPTDLSKVDQPDIINSFFRKLRLRYNTRSDLWYIDVLGIDDRLEQTIECTSIICDAQPLVGTRIDIDNKPRISMTLDKDNISTISRVGNTIIIRGV